MSPKLKKAELNIYINSLQNEFKTSIVPQKPKKKLNLISKLIIINILTILNLIFLYLYNINNQLIVDQIIISSQNGNI